MLMLPGLGTWNFGVSVLGSSVSQTFEPMFSNHGTTGSTSSRTRWFPNLGTNASQTLEPMLPNLGTTGSQFEELLFPKPCSPTNASQSWNLGLAFLGRGSQTFGPMLADLAAHCAAHGPIATAR